MSAILSILILSVLLGVAASNHLPRFHAVEELRWHQPICTTAGPCYRSERANEYRRVLEVREVRESIDISEIDPPSDELVLYEKNLAEFGRHFVDHEGKPSMLVTRVLDSPVVARIVSAECIDLVPSCPYGPTKIAIQLPEETDYVLGRTIEAVVENEQSLHDKKACQHGGYLGEKKQAIQQLVDGLSQKKDAVVQTVVNGTKSVVNTVAGAVQAKHEFVQGIVADLNQRKNHVIEAVVNAANAKYEKTESIVGGVVQKGTDGVRVVVDAVNKTKEYVAGAVASVVQKGADVVRPVHEKKQRIVANVTEFVGGVVQKKKDQVQAVVDAVYEKKQQIVGNVTEFVGGVVQKKKDQVQAVVDAVRDKKQQIVDAAANATAYVHDLVVVGEKSEKIEGIVNATSDLAAKKKATLQSVVDRVIEAKDKVEQQLATRKQELVQNLADKKIDAIKVVSDKAQEYIGTASLIKPLVVSQIKQALGKEGEDNKLEEEVERRIDEDGEDLAFVDGETQERELGIVKHILEKIKQTSDRIKHIKAGTTAAPPSTPAQQQQIVESSPIPAEHEPVHVEILASTTTEKVIAASALEKKPTAAVEKHEMTSTTVEPDEVRAVHGSPGDFAFDDQNEDNLQEV